MAIERVPALSTDDKIGLEFNNGDYKALKAVVELWDFKDIESAIRFGVAVLLKGGESKRIQVKDSSGERVTVEPNGSLLKVQSDGDKETIK